ncbi:hypothetical protein Bca4012_069089 [Brassica carinata]|uniref:Uncharacterized protein n=1 Tax=Brassica carinata TaxID=52824 RepID=A0A8X7P7W9_BRACI|nr:hypothetical protein Bca52824_085496 [Brassica carinata]
MHTLRFEQQVSGVELGAAKSSKDGKDVGDLIQQLALLKDTIAMKDKEIERLHSAKDIHHAQSNDLSQSQYACSSLDLSVMMNSLVCSELDPTAPEFIPGESDTDVDCESEAEDEVTFIPETMIALVRLSGSKGNAQRGLELLAVMEKLFL